LFCCDASPLREGLISDFAKLKVMHATGHETANVRLWWFAVVYRPGVDV
jgi:hypothetical protein